MVAEAVVTPLLDCCLIWFSTSVLVILTPLPEAAICWGANPCSATSFLTAGLSASVEPEFFSAGKVVAAGSDFAGVALGLEVLLY